MPDEMSGVGLARASASKQGCKYVFRYGFTSICIGRLSRTGGERDRIG